MNRLLVAGGLLAAVTMAAGQWGLALVVCSGLAALSSWDAWRNRQADDDRAWAEAVRRMHADPTRTVNHPTRRGSAPPHDPR